MLEGDILVEPVKNPLVSSYADDPAIAEILPIFLRNLSKYIKELEASFVAEDWSSASRLCHDLKGTAGGYGYAIISETASELELLLKSQGSNERKRELVEKMRELSERAGAAILT